MRSLCLKVPRGEAESLRKKLLDRGLLDISLKIKNVDGSVYLPVASEGAKDLGFELEEGDFEERELAETDYRKLVPLPPHLAVLLPVSFDVIGDVAIIRLEDELVEHATEIGRAMMKAFPRLRTVALDRGVKGELRVRDLEVIAGGPGTETMHTEYGLRLLVDPATTYFNPRLANERRRVASLVKDGEVVVDMFAGVGPFSLMIAKYAHPEMIFAMDLNHDAIEYMKRNIELNKIRNVLPLEGDARQLVFDVPCADRIIMNLPHSARDFFHDALTRLKFGGTIHFYIICERDEIETVLEGMITDAKGMGVRVEVTRKEELKTYSPSMSVFSADLSLVDWV